VTADVLVVGAGIAGMTVAAELRRLGVGVDVVERTAHLQAAGAGIMLHPNALTHLAHLGPGPAETGAVIERQLIIDRDGTSTVLDWASVWGQGRLPLAIHRGRLAELMLAALPPATVRWSAAPQRLAAHDDEVVVTFADGRQRRYRMVVGADGVHSWVRRCFAPEVEPHYLGQTYWRTTVPARAPLDFPEWRVWRAANHFFGAMPIGDGRVHVFLQAGWPDPTLLDRARPDRQMRRLAAEMGSPVVEMVGSLDLAELRVRPALGLIAPCWVHGRIVLVGDAAHSVPPSTTQGGALAIEDAAVLADEVGRHGLEEAALRAYELRRRPRVASFARHAQLHATLMESLQSNPTPGAGRDVAGDAAGWFQRLYRPLLAAA
jgi:2-polyprenyl-6-methoxyphenol hydroxylase-like FAD-dependent oxidoreductase